MKDLHLHLIMLPLDGLCHRLALEDNQPQPPEAGNYTDSPEHQEYSLGPTAWQQEQQGLSELAPEPTKQSGFQPTLSTAQQAASSTGSRRLKGALCTSSTSCPAGLACSSGKCKPLADSLATAADA